VPTSQCRVFSEPFNNLFMVIVIDRKVQNCTKEEVTNSKADTRKMKDFDIMIAAPRVQPLLSDETYRPSKWRSLFDWGNCHYCATLGVLGSLTGA